MDSWTRNEDWRWAQRLRHHHHQQQQQQRLQQPYQSIEQPMQIVSHFQKLHLPPVDSLVPSEFMKPDDLPPKLIEADVLLLFTPHLPNTAHREPGSLPFEWFGRALSKHHPKVRHVQYVPGAPLLEIHRRCLELEPVEAVVVVVCDSRSRATSPLSISSLLNAEPYEPGQTTSTVSFLPPTPPRDANADFTNLVPGSVELQDSFASEVFERVTPRIAKEAAVLVTLGSMGGRRARHRASHVINGLTASAAMGRAIAAELFGREFTGVTPEEREEEQTVRRHVRMSWGAN